MKIAYVDAEVLFRLSSSRKRREYLSPRVAVNSPFYAVCFSMNNICHTQLDRYWL